jgi:hypothetical protein
VEFGTARRRHGAWLTRLALAAVVVAAMVVALYHQAKHPSRDSGAPPVSITRVGHRLLGISASYELFGLTSNEVVSIQFAPGQITRAALPPALADAPVSLVITPHAVIIRPLDNGPGYVVPEGQRSRSLTGRLARGGQLLPGSSPVQEWNVSDTQQITLIGPAGTATGQYSATVSRPYPVHAAPPRAGLNVVTWQRPAAAGVVSPDGALAAVTVASGPQGAALDLVNLSTGRTNTIPVPVTMSSDSQTLVWSPDSRWLFVLTGTGQLVAVRASDGSVHSLGVRLPRFSQIAILGTAG